MKIHTGGDQNSTRMKFARVFEDIDEIKQSLVKMETRDELQKEEIDDLKKKIESIQATLYQIVGKESVRSSIYGVIGAIVASVATWLLTLLKGAN